MGRIHIGLGRFTNKERLGKSEVQVVINWKRVGIIAGAAVLVALIAFGIRGLMGRADDQVVTVTMRPQRSYVPPTPRPSVPPDEREARAIDISSGAVKVVSKHESIDLPGICKDELVYSAGTGRADTPVLSALYLYNIETQSEKRIAKATVKNGEIYEQRFNEKWIVWVDTDQLGENNIYCLNRQTPDAEPTLIKNCKYQRPKLRLYDSILLWIEQTSEEEDLIFLIDLTLGEDLALSGLTDQSSYGVSAPSIYGTQVIWAAPDEEQSEADRAANGEKSQITACDMSRLGDGDGSTAFTSFHANMYVHEPINNADAWAWLDGNRSPTSALWLRYGGELVEVARGGITTYGFGEDFLMYGRNETVWAYFYKSGKTVRISAPGSLALLPVVGGKRVAWFVDEGGTTDNLYTMIVKEP